LNIATASFTCAVKTFLDSPLSGTVEQPANTIATHKPNATNFTFILRSFH
jgi:hypothetical protein